jgi:hypothetical protein
MIDRREILDAASTFRLLPNIVEKDYVLGWLLAGIDAHPDLSETWIFKGGTCLKKCYFETYRFSEDLDFTILDEGQLDEDFLQSTLQEVVTWITDRSGLTIPPPISLNSISIKIHVSAWSARGRSPIAGQCHQPQAAGQRSSST